MKHGMKAVLLPLFLMSFYQSARSETPVPGGHQVPVSRSASSDSREVPYHWSNVAIVGGGYVPAILFHPARKDLLFARTDIGGAYRRDRATKTWVPIMDGLSPSPNWWYSSPEAIGLDPKDPKRIYLAVGYYASPITGSIEWNGNGAMLVSSDSGKTYLTVPLPFKNGANDNGRGGGERIAVDPGRTSNVYFGTRNAGVYLSTDYGASWTPMTGFPASATMQNSKRSSDAGVVTMTPYVVGKSTAAFYAGVSATGSGADAMGLYVMTEPGNVSAPWTAVEGQPTGMLVQHVVAGPNNKLYLNYTDHEGPAGITDSQLWEFTPDSSYRSGKWRRIALPGGPVGGLALSQSQAGLMLVSTVGRYTPTDTRWLSADYGNTWHEVGGDGASYDSSASPYIKNGSQNWESGIAIDPFNAAHAIYGTGGTVYETYNLTDGLHGGIVKWSTKGALGIEESSIVSMVAPPSGKTLLFAGLGDWAGFAFTDLAKSPAHGNLESLAPAYPSGLDFVQTNPTTIVAAIIPGWKPYPGPKAQISTDGGMTWSGFAGNVATTKGGGTIAASTDGKSFVWAPGDTGVQYRSGADWSPSVGIPEQAQVASDRVAAGVFYGFKEGDLFMSRDGGRNFSIVQSKLPADGRLYVAPGVRGDVWLASPAGGIYRAEGGNDIRLTKLDSVSSADLLGFGAPASGSKTPTVFLWGKVDNSSVALFRSTDNGATFVRINDDLHQWPVGARVVVGDMRRFGVVYIGTNGRGIVMGKP